MTKCVKLLSHPVFQMGMKKKIDKEMGPQGRNVT